MMKRHSKSEINHVIIKMFFVSFARFLINSCFFLVALVHVLWLFFWDVFCRCYLVIKYIIIILYNIHHTTMKDEQWWLVCTTCTQTVDRNFCITHTENVQCSKKIPFLFCDFLILIQMYMMCNEMFCVCTTHLQSNNNKNNE